MKLNPAQKLWLAASLGMIVIVLLDVANVMEVPPIYMMLGFGLLVPIGWWVGPSLEELGKANRRRPPR